MCQPSRHSRIPPAKPPSSNCRHQQQTRAAIMAARDAVKAHAAQVELRKARAGLIWLLLPKIPYFLRLLLSRLFGMSETAAYVDLSTEITTAIIRSIANPTARSIGKAQALSLLDTGVKGRIWISNAVSEVPPQRGIREALLDVIVSMGRMRPRAVRAVRIPAIVPVEAEWTGYRAGAEKDEPLPAISEELKYEALMKECKNSTTMLYFHGGGYYLCDPSSHRKLAKRLAKVTGGRVYSVRYRLAPQNPFPTALLDALVSYLTLLYPPPGSMHEAVPARNIIFAGDSAGGNLALALTQVILQLRRQETKVTWFGAKRAVPLPAGITLFSPWLDIVSSMPSWSTNQKWDYLPSPELLDPASAQPPADDVWPATPPRKRIYVADALALHPLVSVHLNRSWAGAPPVWISCGWECLADENRYLVSRLRADGVSVVFEEYEAMPHVFAAALPKLPESERCVQGCARFVAAARKDPGSIRSSYTCIKAKTLEEREGDVERLTPYKERDVFELACSKVGKKISSSSSVGSRL
ncbi:alpha/beta hydrolase fold-domain-containing protein [Xylaria intraflava]|nr:alpha/beta hydrolase fold-domain-containing protein [Xylaria intraflava]